MYNLGSSAGLAIKSARRIILCPTLDSSEATNQIAISSLVNGALPIAVLQALYDKWWHIDTDNKMMATPQLSEFTFTDNDPVKSESEWYSRVLQDGTRDLSYIFNDITPRIIKQLRLLTASGSYSFFVITSDDRFIGRFSGTNLVPFQIQDGSMYVGSKKLPGYTEHAKDVVTMRMNEANAMDDVFAIPITGGYVTSDSDHWSMTDATCLVSSHTKDGATFTVTETARNPETGANDPVTGITFDEIEVSATSDYTPAASGNWTESSDGVYVWLETDVFLGDLGPATVKFSHSKVDVASVTSTGS